MIGNPVRRITSFFSKYAKIIRWSIAGVITIGALALAAGKIYQRWDDNPDRGAVAMENSAFGEGYSTPVYLDQGWDAAASLWFYNTTQGSGLLPYDFFLALEQVDSDKLFRDNQNIDTFRYLPQMPTFFNPDGLPVGMVKDEYQGKDYMGYTCAACHTGQVNYKGMAIRIDGGPAMADMVGFLSALEKAMTSAQKGDKKKRFVAAVLELDNDYATEAEVVSDLAVWTERIRLYNTINHSHIKYGYGRLDAFGRIYNRVLEYVINKKQTGEILAQLTSVSGERLLNKAQIDKVLDGVNETIIGDDQFALIISRLQSKEPGYPGLSQRQLLLVRNALFNEPDAPVSYPFLWDIAQSDYVQWNGLANNANVGPLGRNTGEVIGVFGILDWTARDPGFSLAAKLSGQEKKAMQIDFKSSINLANLQRLESHLTSLKSPRWPEAYLGAIDQEKARRGELIYAKYCQSCHEVIDREAWDRLVIAKLSAIEAIGTDIAMASNSVNYKGKSGNFKHTYQGIDVGSVIIQDSAPVVQILTSATKGVVATPDADKWFVRRWAEWIYTLVMSLADNEIKSSIKSGNYQPDTTAEPYRSLLSYKARSLNGIWATAPYLHNGSVPTLYDLLLPAKKPGDPDVGEYRPSTFVVGSREFDPEKVGFRHAGYDGSRFTTFRVGDMNTGHEYGSGGTAEADGKTILPPLSGEQRWELIEYLKTL
ncbi:MAG: ribonuclease E [Rhodospirillales bacterium]|nr:ribonuclease E [Rhodospirillales bacterium]